MANLGSGDGTDYPLAIDIQTPPESASTVARAEVPNDLADAVIAIQKELGIEPSGSAIDVKSFLRKEHNIDGSHGGKDTVGTSTTVQTIGTGAKVFVTQATLAFLPGDLLLITSDADPIEPANPNKKSPVIVSLVEVISP